jgi:hypothetical protein
VPRFEGELLEWFRTRHRDVLDAVRSGGDIPDVEAFETAIKGFAEQFSWEEAADEVATGAQAVSADSADSAGTADSADAAVAADSADAAVAADTTDAAVAADTTDDGGASEASA